MAHNLLVVGGNGFVGSAVCKAALAKGFKVTSISSSGRPFKTPKGHSPSWTSKVKWLSADAFEPQTYESLLPEATAVVHTLGVLIEDGGYKNALREGNVVDLVTSVFGSTGLGRATRNPLDEKAKSFTYEVMNRDSALRVCETFARSNSESFVEGSSRRPFIYLSAEDVFRPVASPRYIETKRKAERGIGEILQERSGFRGVYIRPSLIYHAYFRPLTTPLAVLLDASASLHRAAPSNVPTPSQILRSLGNAIEPGGDSPSLLSSVANAMTIPPIHVDHVAEAICKAIADDSVEGVVDVAGMRKLIGWTDNTNAKSNETGHQLH